MPDSLLLGAIAALASVVGVLWHQLLRERAERDVERRESSRLIFALLGERARITRRAPPATASTPEKPQYIEARALAEQALNGDIDERMREFLDPPSKGKR